MPRQLAYLAFICIWESSVGFVKKSINPRSSYKALNAIVMNSDLDALQALYFDEINQAFSLKKTDFCDSYNAVNWESGTLSGSAEWWDETKGSKLTGVSKYWYQDKMGSSPRSSYSLNVWLGPSYLVPDLLLKFGECTNGYFIESDYVARGPNPIGNDFNYLDSFYPTSYIESYYDEILKQVGASSASPSPSFAARLLRCLNLMQSLR